VGDAGADVAAGGCGAAALGGACEALSLCADAGAFKAASSASDDADRSNLRLTGKGCGPIMTKFLT
jgi:hypothetical protein